MTSFAVRGARSPAVTIAIGVVLAIETVAIHLLLAPRHGLVAWSVTGLSLATLAWLVADYAALGDSTIDVDSDTVRIAIGRRISATVPRERVRDAAVATWRDHPDGPDATWLNATKPADPNVIVTFDAPTPIRLFGIANRPVQRLGLCVDEPLALVAALQPARDPAALPVG